MTRDWHAMTVEEALADLRADTAGLTSEEVARRLERHGPNTIDVDEGLPWWRLLARQFVSPLIGILVVALAVTALIREWVDAVAIFVVLLLNAGIGYWQESRAQSAVLALKDLSAPTARVLRDGTVRTVAAADLVPGDVVPLESGERVPADLRVARSAGLRVDESMLTGETLAVTKTTAPLPGAATAADRTNIAFSGTLVTSGRGLGVVVGTGADTQLGSISALVQQTSAPSPLQVLMHNLERRIGVVVAIGTGVVFVAGLVLGYDASAMFRTAVALAVASVPESLPIVLTVAMSLGVARMARRGAVVRSLHSVETLGSTTVIGSDKTGTLTRNEMTVRTVWTVAGTLELDEAGHVRAGRADGVLRDALRTGALTNEAVGPDETLHGDAVDVALARAALRAGAVTPAERARHPLAHTPYEPALRYSQTVRTEPDGTRVLHVKGSPDVLAEHATAVAGPDGPLPVDHALLREANERMAAQGRRVIATARRVLGPDEVLTDGALPPPHDLTLLGLHALEDPPRPGVAESVAECQAAGITVAMITGDHPATASSIARRLGIASGAPPLTGAELATLDDDTALKRLRASGVAARVTPADKLRLVELLREDGEVVAVTGDGVNDAPALKAASIGVAMGRSGTDVAREAADLVLTDDDFVTIVDAVRQGRVTFSTIRNATFFLLATGLASLLAVSTNVMAQGPLLFLPIQLLFVNVVTNGLQDIAMAFEPPEGDELTRPPRSRREGLLSSALWWRTLVVGVWMAVVIIVAFRLALSEGYDVEHARTMTITIFVMMNFFLVGSARSDHRSLLRMSPVSNVPLWVSSIGALLLHLGVMSWGPSADLMGFVPLSAQEWLVAIAVGATVLVIVEVDKAVRRRPRPVRPQDDLLLPA